MTMKLHRTFALLSLALAAGCLSPAPKAPVNWTVGPVEAGSVKPIEKKWDSVRLSRLEVRAPYDGQRLAVLRKDGSLAFDPFNSFAASPTALLKGAAFDVLAASGIAGASVEQGSSASAARSLEITVTQFALDCRADDEAGKAAVSLTATLVEGRGIAATSRADATVRVDGGDFTKAFSQAFSQVMQEALRRL